MTTPADRGGERSGLGLICQDCKMPNADGYHPHLHCVIWEAYHRDPAVVLAEHGYVASGPEVGA